LNRFSDRYLIVLQARSKLIRRTSRHFDRKLVIHASNAWSRPGSALDNGAFLPGPNLA
jgi:hypothetical protein